MNNEPVAWFEQDPDMKSVWHQADKDASNAIPLYTHPAKTKELLDEIKALKEKLMMEEESYMLLDEESLFAKESIKHQKAEIEALKAKTLTDKEIIEIAKDCGYANRYELNIKFARAILRKAQEK